MQGSIFILDNVNLSSKEYTQNLKNQTRRTTTEPLEFAIELFCGNNTVDTFKSHSNFCVLEPPLLSYLIDDGKYTPTEFTAKLSNFYDDNENVVIKFLDSQWQLNDLKMQLGVNHTDFTYSGAHEMNKQL